MGGLGAPELIIILLVVLLLFGSTKLPKLAKSLGEASKEFKKGVADSEATPPVVPAPAAPPIMTASAPPVAPSAVEPPVDEKVTLTRAELDALLAAREAQVRRAEPGKDVPPAV
jgi:sec-independent protein translocase protein TatA